MNNASKKFLALTYALKIIHTTISRFCPFKKLLVDNPYGLCTKVV